MNFPYSAQYRFLPTPPLDRAYTNLEEASVDDYETELTDFYQRTVNVVERYQARLKAESLGVDDLLDLLNRKSSKLALVEVVNYPSDSNLHESGHSVRIGSEQLSSNDSLAFNGQYILVSDLKSLADRLREVQTIRRKLNTRAAALENVQSELYAKKAALEESLTALDGDSKSLRQDRPDDVLVVIDVAYRETKGLLATVESAIEYSRSVQLRCNAALADIEVREQCYLDLL